MSIRVSVSVFFSNVICIALGETDKIFNINRFYNQWKLFKSFVLKVVFSVMERGRAIEVLIPAAGLCFWLIVLSSLGFFFYSSTSTCSTEIPLLYYSSDAESYRK